MESGEIGYMQTPWGSEVYDLSGLAPSNSKSEQGQANDFFRFILVNLLMQLLMPTFRLKVIRYGPED
ncbi:hypothetical protein N7507_001381 [Penicillium longicatenatum]|nr:hypothetical protein N7507_001381 [Penicillium longicatenatum]